MNTLRTLKNIQKKKMKGLYHDERWLDFVEGELEMNLLKDMEVLLQNSLADRRTVKELERVRKLVKEADDVALPEDGHYYDGLHAKIMLSVDEADTQKANPEPVVIDGVVSFASMWTALTRRW